MQSATYLRLPTMTPSLIDDLIAEILSFLPVKPLLRFKCVSKSWKTLISHPTFVKLHLKRSAIRNPHFTLITCHSKFIPGESPYGSDDESELDYSVVPYPISGLLDNPSFTLLFDDPYYHVTYRHVNDEVCSRIIGSCNGLICLASTSVTHNGHRENWRREYWLRVWNPSTRTTSEKFGYFCDFGPISVYGGDFNFLFGFDNSTDTYKVVAFRYGHVKILGSGDHVWRDIEFFPVVPLHLNYLNYYSHEHSVYGGVYLRGTLNWLAIQHDLPYYVKNILNKNIRVEHFVIVSLDLETETYNQYMLPRSFDEVPLYEPTVGVLGGCLSFSYSHKETNFVIWQMKKFGVEDSWSQFLKISFENLQIDFDYSVGHFHLVPLLLSKDGGTLIIKSSREIEAIIYRWKDNVVRRTKVTPSRTITNERIIVCWESAKDYVESLVPIF